MSALAFFIVFCFVLFDCCLLQTCFFLKGNRGVGDLGENVGGKQGGAQGQETVDKIYYMREESVFNKNKR